MPGDDLGSHEPMIEPLLGAAASFGIAFALSFLVRPLALRYGHVDRPSATKRHGRVVPLGGGIAIFWAMTLPALAAIAGSARVAGDEQASGRSTSGTFPAADFRIELASEAATILGFLIAALLIHLGGVWDDQRALSPGAKITMQIIAAAALVTIFDVGVLPRWLDPVSGGVLAILWIVAVTNAFNFLDGSDGLAALVGILCAAMFALSALVSAQTTVAFLCALVIGALLAFLWFNFPPAKLFMGDGGAQLVGFTLAFLSLRLTYFDAEFSMESPWYAVFTPAVVLAIPLYDLATVVALRLAQRRSPFRGDDQHFLHRLARRGMGPRGVLVVVGACTVATGLGGVMLARLEAWQAILVVLQTAMTLTVLALLELPTWRIERQSASAETPSGLRDREPRAVEGEAAS